METIEQKAFRDQQLDVKRALLELNLKRARIKNSHSSQLTSSPRMSISGISSIHGDNPTLDFSYCSSSVSSTRAGSVVLASSHNLKKKIPKSLNDPPTSSAFEQTLDTQKVEDDRAMMPPPSIIRENTASMKQSSRNGEEIQLVQCHLQRNDNQMRNNKSTQDIRRMEASSDVEILDNESRSETLKQNGRAFKKWTVRLDKRGEIIIRGKLESGEQARSKAVRKRLSATTVLSVRSHKYHLLGNIHDAREELPEYVRGKFFNGFPTDWENVREVWTNYVALGSSVRFRWPRPMADSDDDLRSDITDLTVPCAKQLKSGTAAYVSTPHPARILKAVNKTNGETDIHRQHKRITEASDISLIYSQPTESFNTTAGSTTLETGCKNTEDKTRPKIDERLHNQNHSTKKIDEQSTKIQNEEPPKSTNFIPRWKVDIIIDNLMNNKHCSKEYIEKIITAIDCINELVSMSPTNDVGTSSNETSVLRNNSKGQTDTTNGQNPSETVEAAMPQNANRSGLYRGRAGPVLSEALSSDSFSESEEVQSSNHHTFVSQQTLGHNTRSDKSNDLQISRNAAPTAEHSANHTSTGHRHRNDFTPIVQKDTRQRTQHSTNNKNQVRPESPKNKSSENFYGTDSDSGVSPVFKKPNTNSASQATSTLTNSQSNLYSEIQSVASKRLNKVAEKDVPVTQWDSDVSIIDSQTTPRPEPRVISIKKMPIDPERKPQSNFSFMEKENNNQARANSSILNRSVNTSMKKDSGMGSSSLQSADKNTIRLNRVPIDAQDSAITPSLPKKMPRARTGSPWPRVTGQQRRKIVSDARIDENPESDSENVSVRMSSRGRRILPPLDYWNGERVTLKGQELIYSPSTCRQASVSASSHSLRRSLLSPNTTAVSEPTTTSKNLIKTNTETTPLETSNTRYPRRRAGILTEVTSNNDQPSKRRLTTKIQKDSPKVLKKTRRLRSIDEDSDSSGDNGKIRKVPNRKRRKIK